MTQKSEIVAFLLDNPDSTTKDITAVFNDFPASSVRRVLSDLRKKGINIKKNKDHRNRIMTKFVDLLEKTLMPGKPTKEEIKEAEQEFKEEIELLPFRRKIVKSVWYCPNEPHRAGFGKRVFALTYEQNEVDRFDELLDALQLGSEELEQGLQDFDFNFFEDRGNRTFINVSDCVQASEFGYDDELEIKTAPFEFPVIEVGEE